MGGQGSDRQNGESDMHFMILFQPFFDREHGIKEGLISKNSNPSSFMPKAQMVKMNEAQPRGSTDVRS